MKHKLLDWFLIIVVLIGGVLTWQTGRERSRLTARHGRLAKLAGDLRIADPSKVYVLALDTGEPLHFAWRMYFPPNYKLSLLSRHSGVSVFGTSRPSEFIGARCAFARTIRVRCRSIPISRAAAARGVSGMRSWQSFCATDATNSASSS